MKKVELKLDWCTYEAAKYAVLRWHYSRRMPHSKMARIGVWENGVFIGVLLFGAGATNTLVKQYGLTCHEGCELLRVAMGTHVTPVSRIVAIAIRMIKKQFPKMRLVVSFADPERGHTGGIYKAGGWIFTGRSAASVEYIYRGRRWHSRSFASYKHLIGSTDVQVVKGSSKFRYLMPLDDDMLDRVKHLAKCYPTASEIQTSGIIGNPAEKGRCNSDPDALLVPENEIRTPHRER